MNNRWCIIGTPRTGSNYLEDMLFWNMHNQKKFTIRLGELMHRTIWSYADSTGYYFKKDVLYDTDIRKNFTQDLFSRLSINSEFGAVLRFFVQTHYMPDIDYKLVIDQLKSLNFKFIHLTRNAFDSTVSLCMAQATNLWHRSIQENSKVEIIDGNAEYAKNPTKINIPLTVIGANFIDISLNDYYNKGNLKNLEFIKIRYESMLEDCNANKIPITEETAIKKLHDQSYSELIENYDEIERFYEGLNING